MNTIRDCPPFLDSRFFPVFKTYAYTKFYFLFISFNLLHAQVYECLFTIVKDNKQLPVFNVCAGHLDLQIEIPEFIRELR